jgi:glycosyltransferase involved in cell wall biosynthesis
LLERAASRIGLRAMEGPDVFYCVLSSAERELFPRTWRVDSRRVFFTPYHHTLRADELAQPAPDGYGVFAGGDSMRDYGPLIEAAQGVPADVTLATRDPSILRYPQLPPNVRAGPVPPGRFLEAMRAARVVVVPLIDGERSAGQQTYLNAMAMGKIVVATDTPGVRDYVTHGTTGLVVPPGDAVAMADALRWALEPANEAEAREMRARARDVVRDEFTPDRYVARVLGVVASVLE